MKARPRHGEGPEPHASHARPGETASDESRHCIGRGGDGRLGVLRWPSRVFALIGAGTLGAASMRLQPYRPWFLALTAALLGVAFVTSYRTQPAACADGSCTPSSQRTARAVLWIVVVLAVLLVTFDWSGLTFWRRRHVR